MKLFASMLCLLLMTVTALAQDRAVQLTLSNAGGEPLSCKIVFGHWVERDLGELAPGAVVTIDLLQASKDRALYINRYDNQRQMMIENIVCGRLTDWRDTIGQIDLTRARQQDISHLEATCAAPVGAGRVACDTTGLGL